LVRRVARLVSNSLFLFYFSVISICPTANSHIPATRKPPVALICRRPRPLCRRATQNYRLVCSVPARGGVGHRH
jgi:hypothetical protein